MHKKIKILLILLILLTQTLTAQVGGQGVYRFLNLSTSARQAALGGKTITLRDYDVTQAINNPAAINEEMNGNLALNYGNYLGNLNYGTASYALTYDRHIQTLHAGITHINYGKFDGRDEQGQTTTTFTANETALSIGYAYAIPYTNINLGLNTKIITSQLENYLSLGVATDIGINYVNQTTNENLSIVLKNLGTQITTYHSQYEKLPLELLIGYSKKLDNLPLRWHITLENLQQWNLAFPNPARTQQTIDGEKKEEKINFLTNTIRHVILATEILPDKNITFRLSYNFRRAAELSLIDQQTFSGFSAGIGIKFEKIRFDYAYSRYTLASNASMFGLMINL